VNCWEFMNCEREKGGEKAIELGVCPSYPDHGHHCARIAGTLCNGEVQGTFAHKKRTCCDCGYYNSVYYDAIFKELLPY